MIAALAYAPRRTPLGAAGALAASAFLGSFVAVAFAFSSPIVLAGAGAAVVVAGAAAGAGAALRAALRWSLALGVFVVLVNGLVSQRGDTVLVYGIGLGPVGPLDVSTEALAEGAVLALRIAVVMAAFAVHSACVDPDRVLRLLRPLAARSALTATLIARMVPLAAADHARLREASALRGPGAAPAGRAALARRLVAGSLDRAVDAAATLELRGYSKGVPRAPGRRRRSRHDRDLGAAALAVCLAAAAALLAGAGGFDAYPTAELDTGAATLALALSLPLLAALPSGVRRG